ncbi:MAG: hypothetical protein OZ921_03580 [Sorangiineae bacterium]|nr:hypothetical protein [Polyangiaceae bacterium]MEB2321570.1 hypothetical protein [Sorangiineae bacterium]
MTTRRDLIALAALAPLAAACEALGIKGTVITSVTQNGHTTVRQRDFKNWDEFEEAMGEVATDFSEFAKQVGAVTRELISTLTDVPPPGKVKLGALAPSLAPFEGNLDYDYLTVASMQPDAPYQFEYVRLGMPDYDAFFKASAELYATAYQLLETGRHIVLANAAAKGERPPSDVEAGKRRLPKSEVEQALGTLRATDDSAVAKKAEQLEVLYGSVVTLGQTLAARTADTLSTGAALVASAPAQIVNPKLVLHLDLIVKGLTESLALVKDTGALLGELV